MKSKIYAAQNEANATAHTAAATVLGLIAALGALLGVGLGNKYFYSLAIAAGVGLGFLIWRIISHDKRAFGIHVEPEIIVETEEVIVAPDKHHVPIGKHFIWQPNPGDFAKLLRHAIDGSRKEFALRTAVKMGWTEAEYYVMVSQLFAVGWFSGDRHNRAFSANEESRAEIRDWLNLNPPTPSDSGN